MKVTKPNRIKHSYSQILCAPPDAVFPLLCPVEEEKWVPGWKPAFVISSSGVAERDCIFQTAGELNGQYVKLAKLKGAFIWHHHENEDELFMVIKGKLTIKLKAQDIELNEGQFFIIPRGVEHPPVAEEECHVMLFEPQSVLNTGNTQNEKTVANPEKI